jgi:hypothetical protein
VLPPPVLSSGMFMPDLTAFASALASLKAAKDVAVAMIGLRDTAAFQGKLIEFQSKIIDANDSAFAAQEERAALLKRMMRNQPTAVDLDCRRTGLASRTGSGTFGRTDLGGYSRAMVAR